MNIALGHGRTIRPGQIWRSNDPRRFRGIRILEVFDDFTVLVCNIVTRHVSTIAAAHFTIGQRGWSLERDAKEGQMRVHDALRETTERRPGLEGDFDGLTRLAAMERLLAMHEEPEPVRRPLWRAIFDLARFALIAGIIWTGPKLTPAQAAAVLSNDSIPSNVTHVQTFEDGEILINQSRADDGPFGAFAPFPRRMYVGLDPNYRVWSSLSVLRTAPSHRTPAVRRHTARD